MSEAPVVIGTGIFLLVISALCLVCFILNRKAGKALYWSYPLLSGDKEKERLAIGYISYRSLRLGWDWLWGRSLLSRGSGRSRLWLLRSVLRSRPKPCIVCHGPLHVGHPGIVERAGCPGWPGQAGP